MQRHLVVLPSEASVVKLKSCPHSKLKIQILKNILAYFLIAVFAFLYGRYSHWLTWPKQRREIIENLQEN